MGELVHSCDGLWAPGGPLARGVNSISWVRKRVKEVRGHVREVQSVPTGAHPEERRGPRSAAGPRFRGRPRSLPAVAWARRPKGDASK